MRRNGQNNLPSRQDIPDNIKTPQPFFTAAGTGPPLQSIYLQMPGILGDLKVFFDSRSVSASLVGGYIRDVLLGIPVGDIDIAVHSNAIPLGEELARQTRGTYVPLGHGHNQARIIIDHPADGRCTVDISGFDSSLEQDLGRRDFTADAMALPVENWDRADWRSCIIDPLGGLEDLIDGIIRAAGPSVFKDDPARLLRAVRLSAHLGFLLHPETASQISQDAHLVGPLPGERLRDELLAIIASKGAKAHLSTLDNLGLLCGIIPELNEAKGVEQPKEHYWDVFDHSLETVGSVERVLSRGSSGTEPDPVAAVVPWSTDIGKRFDDEVSDGHSRATLLKLGALLHDIAKPQTKMIDAKGKTRFLGHHTLGASMSRDILTRLRVSNRGTGMVATMVDSHLRPMQMRHGVDMPTPRAVYRYFRDVGDVAIDTLYLNLADHLAARGPLLAIDGWTHHIKIAEHILRVGTQEQAPEVMPRLITGHDLIGELGLTAGPLVGNILDEVRGAQVAGEITTRNEALEMARRQVSKQDGGEQGGKTVGAISA